MSQKRTTDPDPVVRRAIENREQIVEYVGRHPGCTSGEIYAELGESLGVGNTRLCNYLAELCQAGRLNRRRDSDSGPYHYHIETGDPRQDPSPSRHETETTALQPELAEALQRLARRARRAAVPLEHAHRRIAVLRRLADIVEPTIAAELAAVADHLEAAAGSPGNGD